MVARPLHPLDGLAAWQLYEMLTNTHPDTAADLAGLAATLDLTRRHPRLAAAGARRLEAGGDPDGALALIEAALAARAASTDPAWPDLVAARDAINARQVAAARLPAGPAPHRAGHTAPTCRPDRRRFQIQGPVPTGPEDVTAQTSTQSSTQSPSPPPVKPRSRSRCGASHARRTVGATDTARRVLSVAA